MKKRGFTLAETLVVLSIIGIVTALTLPHLTDLEPNKNKIMYLRTYDALATTLKSLASNSTLYPACEEINGTTYCFPQNPLLNFSRGVNDILTINESGAPKLCKLLAKAFNASDNERCSQTNDGQYHIFTVNNPQYSFTTPDNIDIYVTTFRSIPSKNNAMYGTEIVINVDKNANNSCMKTTNNDNCTNPNIFEFIVDSDGAIYPSGRDIAGDFYLKNRTSTKHKTITDLRTVAEKQKYDIVTHRLELLRSDIFDD